MLLDLICRFSLYRVSSSHRFLDGLGDVLVAVTHALIAADFGVLALTLLHERLELGIVALGDGLGLHLNDQAAAGTLDALLNLDDGFFQAADTQVFVQARVGEDVERGRNQLDLDLRVVGVLGLGSAQSGLDSVDTLVSKAGDFNVGADLGWLRGESLADVELDLICDGLAGESGVVPNLGVAAWV